MKCIEIICKLFCINMLHKKRRDRSFMFTSFITFRIMSFTSVRARDIFLTNFMPIKHVNSITNAELSNITKRLKAVKRKEKTIRFFATKLNCLYVALIWIHISTNIITIFVLLADKVIGVGKFHRELPISRKINAKLSFYIIEVHANSVTKTIAKKKTICIRVLTYIFKFSYICFISHFYLSISS